MIFANESCWGRWWDLYQDHPINIRVIHHSDWSPSADFYRLLGELEAMAVQGSVVFTNDGERLRLNQVGDSTFKLERIDGTRPHRWPYADPKRRRGGTIGFIQKSIRSY